MDLLLPFKPRTSLEILSVVLPSFWLTFISANLSSAYFGNMPITNFLVEFLITITPFIYITTLLAFHLIHVNLLVATLACVVIFVIRSSKCHNLESQKSEAEALNLKKPFITNVRSNINVLTAVCILAVDFNIFPHSFMKTEKYGFSLMDVGVGLYVYANGIVAPEIRGYKNSLYKTFLNILPLLVIGVGRFFMTQVTHYHVHLTEYGRHWNFFITLAVTKLLSAVIMAAFESNLIISAGQGVLVLTAHQVLLNYGVESYVFSNAGRENFVNANREGIVSSLGYVGLYFLSISFGFLIHQRHKLYKQLAITNCLLVSTVAVLYCKFNISRCLANSTYCVWVLFLGVFMTSVFYVAEQFMTRFYVNLKVFYTPFIYDAINYNGLLFFLVANLLTGIVNIVFETKKLESHYAILILTIYMMATSLIVCFFYVKKIRLKL